VGVPVFDHLLGFPLFYLTLLLLSFFLVHAGEKRLPKDAPMGLVMSLFIPALGHLYVYKLKSLWYVAGLLVLGWALQAVGGWWISTLCVTGLSFGLMYWRLVLKGEGARPEKPGLYTVTVALDAAMLARLNDLMDSTDASRDEVVARALAALPLEEGNG